MRNRIFDTVNGRILNLDDVFDIANAQKKDITKWCDGRLILWITPRHRPIFSSRGEYLGYRNYNEFVGV